MLKIKHSLQIRRLISDFVKIGDKATDTEPEKIQHHLLVYMGLLMGCGGLLWGSISTYFHLFLPASIPFGYTVITIFNFAQFYVTKNFHRTRFVQVLISLLLPFLFQWSLGGFVSSGAMMLWSMLALVGSMTFHETKWGIRWLGMYLILTIFSGLIDEYVSTTFGLNNSPSSITVFFVLNISVISAIVFGLGLYLLELLRSYQGNIENMVVKRTNELNDLLGTLEQRVLERTKALEVSTEISHRLASILDPSQLANAVVDEVRNAYNYYYAQIYLFDENGENLVLAAGTGEEGSEMMKRGHSLPKGRGLVGRAADTKQSILVPDTSKDPNWLPNELLPDTKAEAVVPIVIGEKVLGVLDVQDDVTNDIFPEDLTLLESLAGQVAISLQNSESYAKAEAALQETQSLLSYAAEGILVLDLTTGLFTDPNENAAKVYGLTREELVKVGPARMSPPTQPDGRDSTEKAMEMINIAMEKGTHIFEWIHINGRGDDVPCEIRLVRMPGEKPRLRVTVTDITERKRLQDVMAMRARQQEAINTITQKIQSATTIEDAMQIAARELGHALGKRQTLVALEPAALRVINASGKGRN